MTLQNLIETIQQHLPTVSQVEATKAINTALTEFCARTRILTGSVNVAVVAATAQYPVPATIKVVRNVSLLAANGEELEVYSVRFSVAEGKITFFDGQGNRLLEMPTGVANIKVGGVLAPTLLAALTDEPAIGADYHDYLWMKACERRVAATNPNLALYFMRACKEKEIDGKREANIGGDGTGYNPDPHAF